MENKQQYLLRQYMEGNVTEQEKDELFRLLESGHPDGEWSAILAEMMSSAPAAPDYVQTRWRSLIDSIYQDAAKLEQHPATAEQPETIPLPQHRAKIFSLRTWKIAAAVLLLITLAGYLILTRKPTGMPSLAGNQPVREDVPAPLATRAVVQLADGREVPLDSIRSGNPLEQEGARMVRLPDGSIAMQSAGNRTSQSVPMVNTVFNPAGSKILDLVLEDGSHVWLNAGSSISYPVAFTGEKRQVQMKGEAYFEIARDTRRPFVVSRDKVDIQVLGTKFNVNAYEEDAGMKITLLEGSVKVKRAEASVLLKPGQQAQVGSGLEVTGDTDLDQIMAWKNGRFDFGDGTDLQEIMHQLSRWYDVQIIYAQEIHEAFGGSISRNVSIARVLEKLELTGRVHFKVEGRKITVTR